MRNTIIKTLLTVAIVASGANIALAAAGAAAGANSSVSASVGGNNAPGTPGGEAFTINRKDRCRPAGAAFHGCVRENSQDTEVCFYTMANFRGAHFCSKAGTLSPQLSRRWNDRISSIRVIGPASAMVCSESRLNGQCITIGSSRTFLMSLDDSISSFHVMR
jgi:hypothetical protein